MASLLSYKLGSPSYGDSFKVQKVKKIQEEDCLAIFKPGLCQTGFFGCSEEWYHFQQELMVSKMIVKLFINSFTMTL